uniref:Cytoplasmic protein n=1 Tax=Acetithermum autotrophicum TaxID=1446466 RepID=H5SRD6_ACEAU|nr:cytoplasmic protein [Candidatus Acetothermum autotrophicum]
MKKLDTTTEQIIEKFTHEIQTLYGDELIALILYGSAAGPDFVPQRSDLNFLVVLKNVTPEALRKAIPFVRAWHREKIATPLFVDPEFLQSSLDVFPIEFFDMQERHRLLAGQDVLLDLKISPKNLRLQCEEELKGKLLNLRRAYLETGGRVQALEELMVSSLKSFLVITRHLLRLKGLQPAHEFLEILVQAEEAFGISFEAIRDVHSLRVGALQLDKSNAQTLFERYLADIEQLATCADTLLKEIR